MRIDYKDEDSVAVKVLVETSKGSRELLLSEKNLVVSVCHPNELGHILSETDNMIIPLKQFLEGHVCFSFPEEEFLDEQAENVKRVKTLKPQKMGEKERKPKQRVQKKPVKKICHEEESSDGSDELDNTSDKDLVTPCGELPAGTIASGQNTIR